MAVVSESRPVPRVPRCSVSHCRLQGVEGFDFQRLRCIAAGLRARCRTRATEIPLDAADYGSMRATSTTPRLRWSSGSTESRARPARCQADVVVVCPFSEVFVTASCRVVTVMGSMTRAPATRGDSAVLWRDQTPL